MEWLIDLGLLLLIVFIVMKENFISFKLNKPILIPIKIRNTHIEEYKEHGNPCC